MSKPLDPRTPNLKFALLAVAWMALIFILSAQPKDEIPQFGAWDLLVKKGGHLLEYAVLAWLWQRALGSRPAWMAWSIAVAYALSDEAHQLFVPGRNAQGMDICIDAFGAGVGLLAGGSCGPKIRLHLQAARRFILALFGG